MPLLACTVLIAAAADLAPLEHRITLPGCQLTFSFASSGMLARQIEQGAEFDVYLSANKAFVDQLVKVGAADPAMLTPYAEGRIALWSKSGHTWDDLNSVRNIAIANPAHAPYGLAAKQALERQGLLKSVEKKLVFGENVRQTLQYAQTGNAEIAIVAWSLVHDKGGRLIDKKWHDPIIQAAVVPKRARNPDGGKRLLQFLRGPAGRKLLSSHGLEPR